jgi:hypothetical protein
MMLRCNSLRPGPSHLDGDGNRHQETHQNTIILADVVVAIQHTTEEGYDIVLMLEAGLTMFAVDGD